MKGQTLKILSFIAISAITTQAKAQFTPAAPILNIDNGFDDLRFNQSTTGNIRSIRGYTNNYLEIYGNYTQNDGPAIFLNTNQNTNTSPTSQWNTWAAPGSIYLTTKTPTSSTQPCFQISSNPFGSSTFTSPLKVFSNGNTVVENDLNANNVNASNQVIAQGDVISNTGTLKAPFARVSTFAVFEGAVAIGNTAYPSGYKLYVEDGILTEKLRVANKNDGMNWADFVFDENYDLKPLAEVEKFIQKNKHLPEIPSTADVQKNGIDIAEMDAKLLQKIEELTLYVIQQQKEINTLKKKLK